jgi:ribosome-associated toxin RatA of RatAB toxin-antitoxin module
MATVRKSVIVPFACEAMFDLVDDVESYPRFLPWCAATEVFERTSERTRARLDIDYHGLKSSISTDNAKSRPHEMMLGFVDGPFESFRGAWRFAALGDEGCRVELQVDYDFSSTTLERVLGPVFGHIMETLVDRFVKRAESQAGGPG